MSLIDGLSSPERNISSKFKEMFAQATKKKIEKVRVDQVNGFLQNLQRNEHALQFFLEEVNKAGFSRQNQQKPNTSAPQKFRSNKIMTTTQNSSFFNQREMRLQTAATSVKRMNLTTAADSVQRGSQKYIDEDYNTQNYSEIQNSKQMQIHKSEIINSGAASKQYSQKYYYRYIHDQNRSLLRTQKRQREQFIPEKEAEVSNFKQKFTKYMDMLNKEEEKQNAMNPKPGTRNITTAAAADINVSSFTNESQKIDLSKSMGKVKGSLVHTPSKNKLLERHVDIYKSAHFPNETKQDTLKLNQKTSIKYDNSPMMHHKKSIYRTNTKEINNSMSHNQTNEQSNQFQPKYPTHYRKQSQPIYLDNLKKLKENIAGDYFKMMCQDGNKEQFRNSRLTKAKFKSFLSQRYGPILTEKLSMIIDFNNPVDYGSYLSQIESFLKSKEVLRQVAFDIYDFNNDGRLSDIDLFKIFSFFDKEKESKEIFEKAFQQDFITIIKNIYGKKEFKAGVDPFQKTTHRSKYFRNVNTNDGSFENKRKKLFSSMYKIKKLAETGGNWGSAMLKQHTQEFERQNSQISNSSQEREEQDKKEDFFSAQYYQHLKIMKGINYSSNPNYGSQDTQQMPQKVQRASSLKQNSLNVYYQQKYMKQATQHHHQFYGGSGAQNAQQAIGSSTTQQFLSNPKWDQFFNSYMEETQKQINEFLVFEEFNRLYFTHGEIPHFIVDFVDYLTGTTGMYQKVITQNLTNKVANNRRNGLQDTDRSNNEGMHASFYMDDEMRKTQQSMANEMIAISAAQKSFENSLVNIKMQLTSNQFKALTNAFMVLTGAGLPVNNFQKQQLKTQDSTFGVEKGSLIDYCISEQSLIKNFAEVFGGYKCDILAKFIYLFLSNGKDCKQINFALFSESFLPILSDRKEKRSQFIFDLIDVDKDGFINILNLLQILKHHSRTTLFGQEIYKLLMEYKNKNILMKSGFRSQITLNFSTYNKIIPNSCLIDEIQYRLFGSVFPLKTPDFVPPSPFKEQEMGENWNQKFGINSNGTVADYFLTDNQYENLFKQSELENASHIIAKLK